MPSTTYPWLISSLSPEQSIECIFESFLVVALRQMHCFSALKYQIPLGSPDVSGFRKEAERRREDK